MNYFRTNVRLTKRGFFLLLIPYLTASTWYYLFHIQILVQIPESGPLQTNWAKIWFNLSIALSILIGSFYVDKINKLRLIYLWAAIMPIATILLAFAPNLTLILVLIFLLEALFGMGLLAYSVYFRNLTVLEERGRVSGIIVFVSLLSLPLFLLLSFNLLSSVIISVFLGVGTFIIHFLKPREKASLTTKNNLSTTHSYNVKLFLFYLIPWLIFCVVNGILAEIVTNYLSYQFSEILFQAQVVKYVAASFGAFIGGIFADWSGRKVTLSIGLISYGIGAALTGLSSTPEVCIFSAFSSGFSWGALLVAYTLVVWGDLASTKTCAPFYAAGFIPFYFFTGFGYLVTYEIHIPVMYAALVSSFLIFLSNAPIIVAKELQSPYIIEEMNLTLYIQWLKKFIKKQKTSEGKSSK